MILHYREIAEDLHHFTVRPLTDSLVAWLGSHCEGRCSIVPHPPLLAFVILDRPSDAVNFILRWSGDN